MTIPHTSLLVLISNTIRIKTLSVTVAVILLSQGLAWHDLQSAHNQSMDYTLAIIILFCCLLLQIAVNLANDYFDGLAGIDSHDRLGPERAIQSGLVKPSTLAYLTLLITFTACLLGLYLIYYGGWVYLGLGIFSLFGVYAYSGGKKPLASLGLGEVAVFIYFGYLAVIAGYTLQTQKFNFDIIFPATQVGLLVSAIMLVNNIRDITTDNLKNKYTLAVRIGKDYSKILYCCFITLPFFLILFDPHKPSLNYFLIPYALYLCFKVFKREGIKLNQQLGQTSLLVLLWSIVYISNL